MRLDDDRASILQRDAGDTADARLVERPLRHRRSQMLPAEPVDRLRDRDGVVGSMDRQLDERRRDVPLAQMRGDHRRQIINSSMHRGDVKRQAPAPRTRTA
jgi:hypothetical protein